MKMMFAHLVFMFPEYSQGILLLLPTALQFVINFAKQLEDLVTLRRIDTVDFSHIFQVILWEVKELIGRERALICREVLGGCRKGVARLK